MVLHTARGRHLGREAIKQVAAAQALHGGAQAPHQGFVGRQHAAVGGDQAGRLGHRVDVGPQHLLALAQLGRALDHALLQLVSGLAQILLQPLALADVSTAAAPPQPGAVVAVHRLAEVADPPLLTAASYDPEIEMVGLIVPLEFHLMKMLVDRLPVIGMGDVHRQVRVDQELVGAVAGDPFARGRHIDEMAVRAVPGFPVIRELRGQPVAFLALAQRLLGSHSLDEAADMFGHGAEQVPLILQERPLLAGRPGFQVADLHHAGGLALHDQRASLHPGRLFEVVGSEFPSLGDDPAAGDVGVLPGGREEFDRLLADFVQRNPGLFSQPG